MKPSYCKNKCSYSITNKRDDELTYKFEFDEDSKCQDCTDCLLKQTVELCRSVDCPCEHKGVACWECSEDVAKRFADNILQLFEIEECE